MAHGAVADAQHLVRVQRNQLVHLRPQARCMFVKPFNRQKARQTSKGSHPERTTQLLCADLRT